jgi:hypothetical protein
MKEKEHLLDPGVGGSIILKLILKKPKRLHKG